nr:putative transcriptional regulator [uncultured Mediterranean phage uvMED]
MIKTRGFLQLTYVLYHHLDKVGGSKKANCLSVYLSLMKYCWKSNDYRAGLRHSTIEKDTKLSRTTIHRTLLTLTKLNVISTIKGRSGKTYQINPKFVKFEKGMFQNETHLFQNYTSNVSDVQTLVEQQYNNNNSIEEVIKNYKGNQQSIIDNLAKLPMTDLKMDKNNPYYVKLAIQRKEELAANEKKTYVSPQKILQALKSISKNSNPRYREKVSYNKRNNLDYKGNPIAKNKDKV